MSRTHILISAGVLLLLAGSLSACSALATPRQIATYPSSTPYPQPGLTQTYDTFLEFEVRDVDQASEKVIRLTHRVGGSLVESHSWQQEGRPQTTIILAVPVGNAEALRLALLELGTPLQERISSRVTNRSVEGPNAYAYFTVHLQKREGTPPAFPVAGWRPMRTLERAWSVFLSIFGFLVDTLIWILVILGPFVLIGSLAWLIIRHFRSKHVNRM